MHSFDLEAPARVPANATLHTGDSRELLPQVLAELDHDVDFALVDGDHSTEGAAADLAALLDSPRVCRTVILAHDSFNFAVRMAVQGAAGHEKVIYCDPDFVPGRVTAGGFFTNQMWGGFALLLVGIEAPQPTEVYGIELRDLDAYESAAIADEQLRPGPRWRRLLRR